MLIWRFVPALAICLVAATPADARARRSSGPQLMRGIGEAHHPVSTGNGPAQQFFDQGLALVYGFNHEAAYSAFKHAAELDPALAMAWWGMALALGPNYNFPADADREKRAYEAIQRAISLQEKTSQAERAYIQALAARCSKDAKADRHQLGVDYRNAMSKLVQQYPDDLDAATLYAGSMMNLHPWQLWLHDGRPNEGTEEITEVLESVLLRDPNHLGANHYYIHAVEASPHPERGLSSAALLEKLAPAAGHLTHMPSHIYARVGDYAGAARVNANAVAADEKFLRATRDPGMEASMLYLHDLHFLAYAHCMSGNFAEAKRAADKLVAQTQPRVKEMSMLEGFLSTPLFVLMTFERWDDILKIEMPDPAHIYTTGNWHFVRGMALAGLGRVREAERESKACFATLSKLPRDARFDLFNLVTEVARVQENLLAGMIKHAERDHGEEKEEAVEGFSHAVAAEDALNYNEPPAWFPPVRPILGEILLEDGKAAAAEKIFRNALEKTPRYPRALAGLRESLKAQKRIYEAELVDQQLRGTQGKIDKVHSRRVRK